MIDLDRLNALDRDAFVEHLGGVFEHAPWVARAAHDAARSQRGCAPVPLARAGARGRSRAWRCERER